MQTAVELLYRVQEQLIDQPSSGSRPMTASQLLAERPEFLDHYRP
jgi:hypothetical protein